jgi:malate/lactate dehydrogenase
MIRLDHNRAVSQLAAKARIPVHSVERMAVWGNHSPTMFADWRFADAEGKSVSRLINDEAWYRKTLIPAAEETIETLGEINRKTSPAKIVVWQAFHTSRAGYRRAERLRLFLSGLGSQRRD